MNYLHAHTPVVISQDNLLLATITLDELCDFLVHEITYRTQFTYIRCPPVQENINKSRDEANRMNSCHSNHSNFHISSINMFGYLIDGIVMKFFSALFSLFQ